MSWLKKSQEPRQRGNPRSDWERLVNHFGEEEAKRLVDELGEEEAYKKLPERGTGLSRVEETDMGKEITSEEAIAKVDKELEGIDEKTLLNVDGDKLESVVEKCPACVDSVISSLKKGIVPKNIIS